MLECFPAEIGPENIVLNGKDCTDSFGRNSFVECCRRMTVDVQNICVGFVVRGQRKLTYEFRYISGLCGGEIAFRERAQETRAFHFFNFLRGVAVVNPGVVGVACRVEGRRKIVEFEPALTEQSFCAVLFRFLAAEIIGDDMFPAADGSIHPVGREIPVEIRQIGVEGEPVLLFDGKT